MCRVRGEGNSTRNKKKSRKGKRPKSLEGFPCSARPTPRQRLGYAGVCFSLGAVTSFISCKGDHGLGDPALSPVVSQGGGDWGCCIACPLCYGFSEACGQVQHGVRGSRPVGLFRRRGYQVVRSDWHFFVSHCLQPPLLFSGW